MKEFILLSHRGLGQLDAESSLFEVIEGGKIEKSCEAEHCCPSGKSHILCHSICRFFPNIAYSFVVLNCLILQGCGSQEPNFLCKSRSINLAVCALLTVAKILHCIATKNN